MGILLNWIRRNIAQGYQREACLARAVCVVPAGGGLARLQEDEVAAGLPSRPRRRSLGVLCPTFVGRARLSDQLVTFNKLVEQIREVTRAFPRLELFLFVGMQYYPDQEEESLTRLAEIAGTLKSDSAWFIGLSLPGPGKTRTVNAAIRLMNALELDGLAWVDDDVTLEPHCLEQMVRRFFEKGGRGALGATKVPLARSNLASRLLFVLKSVTMPASNYPHACCILVERAVLRNGIPERYASDDGFVCFELLDPSLANPLEFLELVPEARCWHHVGGPAGETVRRIQRMLTNHHVFLADYPLPVARYYFSHILFYGLWPLAPWDRSRGLVRGLAKWFLKALYLVWFLRVGAALLVRGLTRRPIREIPWGGYTEWRTATSRDARRTGARRGCGMNVLGMHTMGHDTGVCYFRNGELAFAMETERITRCRHDHRAEVALQYFLDRTGVRPAEIDWIALSTNIRGSLARLPDLDRAMAHIASRRLHYVTTSEMLGQSKACLVVAHEASHAALACHAAAFPSRCVVLVNEGKGTFSRNSLFLLREETLSLEDVDALPWYGTGFGWSALGHVFGFGIGPGVAGKLMALGGYAEPSAQWRDLLHSIDSNVHHRNRAHQEREMAKFVEDSHFRCDFAQTAAAFATFQCLFSTTVESYVREALSHYNCDRLALAGGCALNVVLNSRLRSSVAPALAISPACNDAGQALGAAIYAMKFHLGIAPGPVSVYSNGEAPSEDVSRQRLRCAGMDPIAFDPMAAASVLERGGIVALMRGRSEIGPRALGNRSLLAHPAAPGMRERVSQRLKSREWFRPLSPVMRHGRFQSFFPGQPYSANMLFAYGAPRDLMPEAVHVDGTARIQTLEAQDNPQLDAILEQFESRSGIPALINTSLNAYGRAMVHSPDQLLDDFGERDVDLFIAGDWMAHNPKAA